MDKRLWVNAELRGTQVDDFETLMVFYGVRSRTDLMRLLITQAARNIRVEAEADTEIDDVSRLSLA